MISVKFPDGNSRSFDSGISAMDIALSISKGLAQNAVACKIDGKIVDLSTLLTQNCSIEIITIKDQDSLDVLRHSCAHLLAQAVKEVYKEKAQVTIGPVTESGFYYDFKTDHFFSMEDLKAIEQKMLEIANKNLDVKREVVSRDEAVLRFNNIKENFKGELIKAIPQSEDVSIYHQGDFFDLCRGPHVPNTSFLRHFKLQKVSGSYWRGDSNTWEFSFEYNGFVWKKKDFTSQAFTSLKDCFEDAKKNGYSGFPPTLLMAHTKDKNIASSYFKVSCDNNFENIKIPSLDEGYCSVESYKFEPNLQRIYGTCFATKKDLDSYLFMLEEAEKRDHRKLGKELGLFHQQEEAPGDVFWHPRGRTLYLIIESYIRKTISKAGYQEVRTPHLMKKNLWEKSGHWEKYKENMFTTEAEDEEFAIKPMNCPGHVQIFNDSLKSYRDLPLRLAEFGCCHRFEPSGALHGLMRVRSMVQDDAHIFCTEEQIVSETADFCKLLAKVYHDFGFHDFKIKLATRPLKRAGTDDFWDKAEEDLSNAVKLAGYDFEIAQGDGAFYAPKLEFHLKDSIGRSWQCGTLQLDYVLPERLEANYISDNGTKKRPVMLHRAILGSLERFIGILIESHAGALPIWLSPVQAVICSITNEQDEYVRKVQILLLEFGIRIESDLRREKIGYKIREHSLKKIPFILICGKNEEEKETISVRTFGTKEEKIMQIEEFIKSQIWIK